MSLLEISLKDLETFQDVGVMNFRMQSLYELDVDRILQAFEDHVNECHPGSKAGVVQKWKDGTRHKISFERGALYDIAIVSRTVKKPDGSTVTIDDESVPLLVRPAHFKVRAYAIRALHEILENIKRPALDDLGMRESA